MADEAVVEVVEEVEEVVEEVVEEESVIDVDPQEKLTEVLEQKQKLAEVEAEMLSQREIIEREEAELHHKLATTLVDELFVQLEKFAGHFAGGSMHSQYGHLLRHIKKIQEHDSRFPKSLSENKYEVNSDERLFWLNVIEKHMATGEPLSKFLGAVFSKPHGTPFSED